MQSKPPAITVWLDFLKYEGISQREADDMPDDELYVRYTSYQVRCEVGYF